MSRHLAALLLLATACGGGRVAAPPTGSATPAVSPSVTSVPSASTGEPAASDAPAAPDFTLRTLDGGTFTLSDHVGTLPVVLNFWAPW